MRVTFALLRASKFQFWSWLLQMVQCLQQTWLQKPASNLCPSQLANWGDCDLEEMPQKSKLPPLDTRIYVNQNNPKRLNSKARTRYERYKRASTLKELLDLGGTRKDALHDVRKGFVSFEPIDGACWPTPGPCETTAQTITSRKMRRKKANGLVEVRRKR